MVLTVTMTAAKEDGSRGGADGERKEKDRPEKEMWRRACHPHPKVEVEPKDERMDYDTSERGVVKRY